MEISWPFPRPGRQQRHRQRPGVATERSRRIDSRRAIEKEQRRGGSTRSCCQHHYRDDDHHDHHHHDHRRQCGSSSTALARTLSAIAVSLVLLSPTATAAAAAAAAATSATAAAATAATAPIHHASPGSTGDPAVAASPTVHDNAVTLTAYETETDPAAASAEVGATRASRKPPPLLHPSEPPPPPGPAQSGSTRSPNRVEEGAIDSSGHENCGASGGRGGSRDCEYNEYYDCAAGGDEATGAAAVPVCCRRPAGEFLAQPVDERDDDRGKFVTLAAPAGCGGAAGNGGGSGGGSAGDCGGVGGGGGAGGVDGDEVGGDIGDGAVASSPTSGRNVEQAFHNVEHELDNVGHGARTAASASDPPIPGGDTTPPAAAAATADDGELEVDVKQTMTPIPSEGDAGAGTPQTEALSNREGQERELNAAAAAVNSAAPSARTGESAEEGVDVGGSIHREAEGVGGGLGTTLAAAPPRQTGGCDLPTTRTTSTDADAVTVPARRGSGRTPLAKTGGCGSKGQSPALGSWAEEQSDEEEGGLPRDGGSDGVLRLRPAGGEVHEVTTHAGADVPAAKGVTAAENGDRSESSEKITYGKEGKAGQGAGQGLVSESGPVKGGALHEEPGRSDDLISAGSAGGAREYTDVGVDPGVDEQGAAGATFAAAAAALDLKPVEQSDIPEMSPTLRTHTGFPEAEGPRVAGTGTDAEKAAAGVFEGGVGNGGVKGGGGGKQQQQQTTTGTRRRDKGGWGWSAPGVGRGKEGFGGGGGGGKEPVTWRKAVIALVAGAAIVLTFAQGNLPRWLPLIGGDLRDGWALDLPPPGSRRGSLLSGRGGDGLGGRYDEPPMPDLVWDEEPETAPPLPGVAAKASHGGGDHEGIDDVPLKWDTRPKAPDHLVFHPVLGVVPTGVLDAWKRASRSGRGGVSGGGRGGRVEGGGATPGTEAVGEGGGGSGDRNESATGASTRRGSNGSRSSSSSHCPAGAPPSVGLKVGKLQPLPPVRYTPEWYAWCAARGEAGDLAGGKSEVLPLQGFPLPKASLVEASADREVGAGDEAGVVVGVAAVGKANPQPQKKSTTPAAIGLQRETAAEVSVVDQAEGGSGSGGGGGGGGGNDGDGHFGENYPDETRDGRSGLSAPASAHPPPMVSRVA